MLIKVFKWILALPVAILGMPSTGKLQSDAIRMIATIHPYLPNQVAKVRSMFKGTKKSQNQTLEYLNCNLEELVKSVRTDGYYVIQGALSSDVVRKLKAAISETKVFERTEHGTGFEGQLSELHQKIGRYDLRPKDLMNSPMVRSIAFSNDWKVIGDAIFGYQSVFDGVASWWMFESDPKFASLNAQAFHSDRERLAFIKFFVYLTDIDSMTGPHVYAKGTHKKRPVMQRFDRRYSDTELQKTGHELVEIYGKAGTVIVANTQGLHKGVAPIIPGHGRLLFQIQVANSLKGELRESLDTTSWSVEERKLGESYYLQGYDRA